MEFTPNVYFVTPVYRRFQLAKVCMTQRRALLDALPFEAHQVVIGDEPSHRQLAESLGFDWVERDNSWISAKFNAGYEHAIGAGATHCMPIGSDSWLHPVAFEDAEWDARGALGLIGLSSVSPWGDERIDFSVKYPAGFGVGMVYPAWALKAGGGADPKKNKGIDTSTWSRCGRGRVQITFLDGKPFSYINFHSPSDSITDYASIRSTYKRGGKTREPWADLRERYGDVFVDGVREVYALNSIGVFLTGRRPALDSRRASRRDPDPRRALPGRQGRKPHRERGIPYGANAQARRRVTMENNFDDALNRTP